MDAISNSIVEFINKQPADVRDKYVAFIELLTFKNDDSYAKIIDTDFSHKDYVRLQKEISKIVIEKLSYENVLTKLK
jgi:hypothetical protein